MNLQETSLETEQKEGLPESPAKAAAKKLDEAYRLQQAGKRDKAQKICEELLAQYPDYVGALHTLGTLHIEQNNWGHALLCFVQAAMYNPADWRILSKLAGVYLQLGAHEIAAQTYEKALALNPNAPEIHYDLGNINIEREEYDLAAQCFENVIALSPGVALAHNNLGQCYLALGRLKEAAVAFEQAYKLDPGMRTAVSALTDLPAAFVTIDLFSAIKTVIKKTKNPDAEFWVKIGFMRARAYDKARRYDEAWVEAVKANRKTNLKANTDYKEAREEQKFCLEEAKSWYQIAPPTATTTENVPTSLFILGPSRSGKTTLERLVSALPGVKCGYENHIIQNSVKRTNQLAGRLSIERLAELPEALYPHFRDIYKADLLQRCQGFEVFTNTMPGIIANVGRIVAAVPKARFVFVKRDIDDLTVRIFFKHYLTGNAFAYGVANIKDYLAWYFQMTDIWAEKFPDIVARVTYEDMITDPKATIARLGEFVGLEPSNGLSPALGDDRGCAKPYLEMIRAAEAEQAQP
jgi:Flp pilus assembly protein TadD